MTYAELRCHDCACLVEGEDGEWVCDEAGMAVNDIGMDECPESFKPTFNLRDNEAVLGR